MEQWFGVDVLLVEDNPRDAELTLRALRRHQVGNRFYVVEDGAEALDFLYCQGRYARRELADLPKVVFLDLKLPKVGGLEVLKQLKGDLRTRSIPVVVLTSSGEDPDVKSAYALGANSYVVKPVDFDAFMTATAQLGLYWLLVNRVAP